MNRLNEKKSAIYALLVALVLSCTVFVLLRDWFELRFENRVIAGLDPLSTERDALTDRVVLFIFDDTAFDTAVRYLPRLTHKAQQRGILTKVMLDKYTYTIAGVYTIGTGDQPALVQIKEEYLSNPVTANHIFENVKMSGGRTVHLGESLWLDMYGSGIDESFTRRDLGPFVEYGSDEMIQALIKALENSENRLIVVHLGETGHVSHRVGVFGERLERLLTELDRTVWDITEKYDRRTTWLVGSDHGTTVEGQHGGVSEEERTGFLAAWGPGIAPGDTDRIAQVDLSNMVTFLLGAPLPTQNCGQLPDLFEPRFADAFKLAQGELQANKQRLYQRLKEKYGHPEEEEVDQQNIPSLKRAIEQIKFDVGSPLELGAYLLLLLLSIVLWISTVRAGPDLRHLAIFVVVLGSSLIGQTPLPGLLIVVVALGFELRKRLRSGIMTRSWWINTAIGAIPAGIVLTIFYHFPSTIYLEFSQSTRYLILGLIIAAALTTCLVHALLLVNRKLGSPGWLTAMVWGFAAAFVIGTPGRYYLYVIPVGFVVLLNGRSALTSSDTGQFLRKFVWTLPAIALLLTSALGQIEDFDLALAAAVPPLLRSTEFYTEVLFIAILLVFAVWFGRHYRGRLSPPVVGALFVQVSVLHVLVHQQIIQSNLLLIAVYASVVGLQLWLIHRETARAKVHLWVLLLITVMTLQQTGVELVFALAGAVLFRWVAGTNPSKDNPTKAVAFTALALIVYAVFFLTVKGHMFRVSHLMIMKGFVGYGMPLFIPLSTALVSFYYLQPLLLAWLVFRATVPTAPRFYFVGITAAVLLLLQAVFTGVLFSFSILPGDTYQKSAVGSVLLVNYAIGIILVATISSVIRRARGSVTNSSG